MVRKATTPARAPPVTFHTPCPRPLMSRIAFIKSDHGYKNSAELLFDAVNSLSKELDLPPLPSDMMQGFEPYQTDEASAK